jgi:hypothetical protein
MKSSQIITAAVLLLSTGVASASCLPGPGSMICQDSHGNYTVTPYPHDPRDNTYEAPKRSSGYDRSPSGYDMTPGRAGGRPDTLSTEFNPGPARLLGSPY